MTTLIFRPFGSSFADVAYEVIARTERKYTWQDLIPRDIGDGHITIGAGLNLDGGHPTVKYAAYRQLGIRVRLNGTFDSTVGTGAQRTAEQGYVARLDAAIENSAWTVAQKVAELHAIMAERAANSTLDGYADNRPNVFALSSGDTGEQQIRQSFAEASIAYDDAIKAKLDAYDPTIRTRPNFENSWEHSVLLSLTWNGGTDLVGPGLLYALSSRNRAAAWYEIRYNSNSATQDPALRPGIANRRYAESEIFGLYDTQGSATPEEAQAIYRVYTDNRAKIEAYDNQFQPPSTFANTTISALITALRPAKNTLIDWLRTSKGIGLNADAYSGTDVLLASELGQTLDGSFGDYRNAPNVLIGNNGTDHLIGGAGDDLLFGSGDIDWLEGGSGNDRLYGNDGIGGDRLEGGAGTDTYHVDEGDTIRDSDGKGSVTLDDNILGTATRRKGEFAYRDSDGTAFVLIGSDLRINGNLLIEGFTSGDLGIVLKEDESDPYDPNEPDDPNDPNDPTDPANPGAPDATAGPGGRDGGGGLGGAGATADGFGAGEIVRSPLILDLDGDGVETLGIDTGITFDHDSNGFAEATGWAGKDDGVLVLDRDGNGQIDNGGELFGNSTQVAETNAANGFAALSALDTNFDGKVDAIDIEFANLRVWRDSNSDGAVQGGELLTLEQAGVASLDTGYVNQGFIDANLDYDPDGTNSIDANENQHRQVGSYTRTDGTAASMNDVWFKSNTAYTVDKDLIEISADIAALPDIEAFGNVHDLRQAMQRDSSGELKALIVQFGQETSTNARQALMTDIIYHWAGVQDVDPLSRAQTYIYDNPIGDSRKLEALEEFVGREFLGTWCWGQRDPNPTGPAATILLDNFDQLSNRVYGQLMLQTHFKPLVDKVALTIANDGTIEWDVSQIVADLQSRYDVNSEEAIGYTVDFIESLKTIIGTESNSILDALYASGNPEGTGISYTLATFSSSVGNSGSNSIIGDEGDNRIYGLGSMDYLYGQGGGDLLFGGQGNDYLFGEDGADVLDGGSGDDALDGGAGNDTYIFAAGYGRDTITDVSGTDVITLGAGLTPADVQLWRDTSNLYVGITGTSDVLTVLGWYDLTANRVESITFADNTIWNTTLLAAAPFFGTSEADALYGTTGNEGLFGFDGDDAIYADAGNDTLDGGTGNDALDGGAGNDTYVFARGHGQDTITDVAGTDVITLGADIAPSDVQIWRDGSSLFVGITGTSDVLTILGWYDLTTNRVESIKFADNTIWNTTLLAAAPFFGTSEVDALYGTIGNEGLFGFAGDDSLTADAGNDMLDGGTGNDALDGGAGNDIYVFARGHGQDTITDVSGTDVITLGADIAPSDVQIWRDASNLYVGIAGTSDVLTVLGWYDLTANRVESITFADNTIWSTTLLAAAPFFGTSEADSLYGTTGNEGLFGFAGDDYLTADAGSDTLDGGTGNDALDGGAGNDTYVFARGHGQDTITDNDTTVGNSDVIRLSADVAPGDVTLSRDTANLYLGINGSTDVITVQGWYADPANRVERIEFADGTVWDSTVMQAVQLLGTESGDYLYGSTGDDVMVGSGGNDILYGDAGNDILNGGAGNDALDGGDGNDTYVFARGHGQDTITDVAGTDVITLGADIAPSDVQIWRDGSSLFVGITGTSDVLTVLGWYDLTANRVESITFADNTIWSTTLLAAAPFFGTSEADALYGTTGNDALFGFAGDDSLTADAGNDTLDGGTGNDALDGGAGNDTYVFARGHGQDTITDVSGTDVITLGADITPSDVQIWRDASSLFVGITGTSDVLTILGWYDLTTNRVESIKFADGTIWNTTPLAAAPFFGTSAADSLYGTTGNNTLFGFGGDDYVYADAGSDTLDGGTGNDALDGGAGNDTYVFARGHGQDTITDVSGTDVIMLGVDIAPSDVQIWRDASSLFVGITGTPDLLTVLGWYDLTANRVESIKFADNTIWSTTLLAAAPFFGTSAADSLYGTTGNNTLFGFGGNDGIYADAGNDTLDGGTGNDALDGGAGNDTYVFGRGYGQDSLSETSGSTDVIQMAADVTPADIFVSRDTYHLYLGIKGTSDKLTIQNWYSGSSYRIEQVKFADDTTWTVADLDSRMTTVTDGDDFNWGTTGNNVIDGLGGDDQLMGNEGDDTLIGGAGNDLLDGGSGIDNLTGCTGDDVYLVDNAGDVVTELADEGTDTVNSSITYTLGSNLENLTLSGVAAINGTGNTLDNVLTGNSAANTLNGGIGADTMIGGLGNDIYVVDHADDSVVEQVGEGTDTVKSSFSYALGTNLERLTLTGSAAASGTGNELNNVLTGNSGANTLIGLAGNDILVGGGGNDTYKLGAGHGRDTVRENDATAGNTDVAEFLSGIAVDQVWMRHVGNNLEASIIGTTDKLIVENWYLGSNYHVEQFKTADGRLLLDSQVENLVQAMAAFAPPTAGQTTFPPTYQDALAPVIAATWQ